MNIKKKFIVVLSIYITLIILSVFLFLTLSGVFFYKITGKYNEHSMMKAAKYISNSIVEKKAFQSKNAGYILEEYKKKYKGLEFDMLSNNLEIIYSTHGKKGSYSFEDISKHFKQYSYTFNEEWIFGKEIILDNVLVGYIFVLAPKPYHVSIPLYTSGLEVPVLVLAFTGLISLLLLLGSIVSTYHIFRISKRFYLIYSSISSYEIGTSPLRIPKQPDDEIGKLANTFNTLTEKIKNYVENEKKFQIQQEELIYNISHDLRTPLTSIIGYSEFIENEEYEDYDEAKSYIQIIKKNAVHMKNIISEILEFSKLKSNLVVLNTERIDIFELCREILITFIPLLQEMNIELEVDILDKLLFMEIDKQKISRAISNLIDNAIKYGYQGGKIRFSSGIKDNNLFIIVKDFGKGISKEDMDNIFERFYRIDKGRNSKTGGSGLGLSISQEIIKMHNGTIKVYSKIGCGSEFTVIIPL